MRARVLSGVALVLGIVAIYHAVFIPLRCNRENKRLQDSTIAAMNQTGARAAVTARGNLDAVLQSIADCPRVPNFYMIAAANYRILERHEDAARMYETTLTLERRPEIYFQLALTLADMGMHKEGVENFVKACRFVPVLVDQVPAHLREEVRAQLYEQPETAHPRD